MSAPRAVRLTFAYDADGIRLLSRTPVGKYPPYGTDAMRGSATGAVIAEIHTAAGQVTYRRTVPHALPATIEVFGGPGGYARVPNLLGSGAFTVVLPTEPPGAEVVLLGRPGELAPGFGAAALTGLAADTMAELGRVPLHEGPVS